MWSPDSRAIAVTWTDGGLVGSWQVDVYSVDRERLRPVNVTKAVRRDLARSYPVCKKFFSSCSKADVKSFKNNLEWVNVAAIKWLDGSKKLVLLAGVPPSSSYGSNMSKVKGYVVEVPSGRIAQILTKRAFLTRWKSIYEYCHTMRF